MTLQTKNNYLNVAYGIGANLSRSAVWYNGKCNWLHSDRNAEGFEVFYPMAYHFYEGTCGTAFFLFNLYKITGEKIFLKTALGATRQAIFNAKENTEENTISFYVGKTGLAYVLLKAALQLNDNALRDEADLLLQNIAAKQPINIQYDLMHGMAGMIPAFIWAGNVLNKKEYINTALNWGEQLLSNAIYIENTLSWNYKNENHLPHTGFAHGSSGMAYAFALLHKFSGEEKFKTACVQAFNYEDKFFNAVLNNWKSIDEVTATMRDDSEEKYQSLWCYGAAGMGLARVAAHSIINDKHTKEMTVKACNVAIASLTKKQNFSLCHGYFSNAELLLCASEYLKDENYFIAAHQFAELGYKTIFETDREWICGTKVSTPSPNFMTGIAGIGNFYLRMVSKKEIASGLILEELLK